MLATVAAVGLAAAVDLARPARDRTHLGRGNLNEPHVVRSFAATREQNIDRVVALLDKGYEQQLLLSNGSFTWTDCLPATFTGEYPPYTQLQLDIIPALRERGATEEQIRRMTVDNARELFERCAQGPY